MYKVQDEIIPEDSSDVKKRVDYAPLVYYNKRGQFMLATNEHLDDKEESDA